MKICRQSAFKVGACPVWLRPDAASLSNFPPLATFSAMRLLRLDSAEDIFAYLPTNCYRYALPMKAHMITFIPLPSARSFSDACAKPSFWKTVCNSQTPHA